MLRKLLKYDLKASGNYLLVGYGVYLVITVLFTIMIRIAAGEAFGYRMVFTGKELGIFTVIGLMTTVFLWIAAVIGLVILTYVLIVRRFYMNMAGDQGYLTLTLPVSTRMHMLSKLISGILLSAASALVLIFGIMVFLWGMAGNALWSDIWKALGQIFDEFFSMYGITYTISTILAAVNSILMIYFSICVGQTFQKHKVWGAIGTYLGIGLVLNIISVLAVFIAAMLDQEGRLAYLLSAWFEWISIAWVGIQILIYFFGGAWLLEKKANLE